MQGPDGNPANRFIIKGPRGGGKTKMMGAIGFVRWLLRLRSIVALGGSLNQAQNVYNYFSSHCYAHESIFKGIPDEPTMQNTISDVGNYFKALAASQKQVRGPHPDDLFIDEACEAKDEIIMSALPMVSSSADPLVVMTSTFHKIFGYFQETWDKAEQVGYTRLSWDIFDVVKVFDPKIWDDVKYNEEIPDFQLLKERAQGRNGDVEGWVPIENVIQAWREKPTLDWFDVEYMGTRPSAAGLVNNPEDVDFCTIGSFGKYHYTEGAEVVGGIDWGFSGMTAWVEMMNYKDGVKVAIDNTTYTQVRSEVIIKNVVAQVIEKKIRFIYADASHPFENKDLQFALDKALRRAAFRCVVLEIPFVRDKEEMLGNYRAYWQRRLIRILRTHKEAVWQHKRYRYQDGTDKPMKKDDHIPDATMLALSHWKLNHSVSPLPKENVDKTIQRDQQISPIAGGLMDKQF